MVPLLRTLRSYGGLLIVAPDPIPTTLHSQWRERSTATVATGATGKRSRVGQARQGTTGTAPCTAIAVGHDPDPGEEEDEEVVVDVAAGPYRGRCKRSDRTGLSKS